MKTWLPTIALICLGLNTTWVLGDDKKAALAAIKQRIATVADLVKEQTRQQSRVETELKSLETQISSLRNDLRKQRVAIKSKNRQLQALQSEASSLQQSLALQQNRLTGQIRSAYMTGHQEQIQLLLNQRDPATLGRLLTYYDYLNIARTEQIEVIQTHLTRLQSVESRITREKIAIETLRKTHATKLTQLDTRLNDRTQFLKTLRQTLANSDSELQHLQQNKQRIQTLLNSLESMIDDIPILPPSSTPFPQLRGSLPWPLSGKVNNTFGSIRAGKDLRWQGLLIQADLGKPVSVIASGQVMFAGWLSGFGLVMIIDHHHDYMSLYAHNSVLFKETGDWVDNNEVIAESGDSGGMTLSGLYFEIRYKGDPVNPYQWLARHY